MRNQRDGSSNHSYRLSGSGDNEPAFPAPSSGRSQDTWRNRPRYRAQADDVGERRGIVGVNSAGGIFSRSNIGTEQRRSRPAGSNSRSYVEELHCRLFDVFPRSEPRRGVSLHSFSPFSLICDDAFMEEAFGERMYSSAYFHSSSQRRRSATSDPYQGQPMQRPDGARISGETERLFGSSGQGGEEASHPPSRSLVSRVKEAIIAAMDIFGVQQSYDRRVVQPLQRRRQTQASYFDFPEMSPDLPLFGGSEGRFGQYLAPDYDRRNRNREFSSGHEPNRSAFTVAEAFAPNFVDFLCIMAFFPDGEENETGWVHLQSILDNMEQYATEWTYDASKHGVHRLIDKAKGSAVNNGPSRGNLDMCCICLSEYQDGDKLVTLRCFHVFHSACIRTWIERSQSSSCPVCRLRIADTSV